MGKSLFQGPRRKQGWAILFAIAEHYRHGVEFEHRLEGSEKKLQHLILTYGVFGVGNHFHLCSVASTCRWTAERVRQGLGKLEAARRLLGAHPRRRRLQAVGAWADAAPQLRMRHH
jgi:hypothetical protein